MKHARLATLLAGSVLVAAAALLRADEKKLEAARPGPEVRRLGYFVGTWTSEGEIRPNAFIPAGKFKSTDTCEWFPGGFHVVCRSKGDGPAGPTRGLGILAWSPQGKVYTYSGIDNSGFSESAQGRVTGNSWTYTSDEKRGGRSFHGRYSMITSPDSYTFKYEGSRDAGHWTEIMRGKTTRVVTAEKK